ncbi:chromosomal replication initiator protein [Humidesulfovibrio mexicanus]|uniref:Chromosomal replication initiator protein DnaA n=1 Tax=Humidesulfovibrio mexicanus TaxID=147047 RepID=A0A238Y1V6_9BACT|nr:chromosomal replication initiator protein DnaA [Humidesulfovibrio mexicanus]SNR64771.1 chromosomal replication initiator protein [Humidesulfovibrio mexicanus]
MNADLWQKLLLMLENRLEQGLFTLWIRPLTATFTGGSLELQAPNEFVATWIRERLLDVVRDAAQELVGGHVDARVVVRKAEPALAPAPAETSERGNRQQRSALALPLDYRPRPIADSRWRFSFEDFVVGPCNELACAASKGLCNDALAADHLFLSAGPGLGKTHLLHAIGRQLASRSNRSRLSIACLSAEEFATRLVLAIKAREAARFKSEFRDSVDVLLLEDIHFFQGKGKLQDELLMTLKALQARGCKVVLTSSFLPRELDQVDPQLVSCFASGFMALMDAPDFATREEIVRRKARSLQVQVPDDVAGLLAERLTTDIRQLESCLNNLVLKARLLGQRITTELAWQVLENYQSQVCAPDMERIVSFVCKSYGIDEPELRSRSRSQQTVLARNTAFYLGRKHTGLSLAAIGERLGRKHSTVLKGIINVEREINHQTPLGRQLSSTIGRLSA